MLGKQHDLISPDGTILTCSQVSESVVDTVVLFEKCPKNFRGWFLATQHICFNLKSVLGQIGIDGTLHSLEKSATGFRGRITLRAYGPIAREFIPLISPGMVVGKLFAADPERRVRTPSYLQRMIGRCDRYGQPLFQLQENQDYQWHCYQNRCVVSIPLKPGVTRYRPSIYGFLPTIAQALKQQLSTRQLLKLHQYHTSTQDAYVSFEDILLVRTVPLHLRVAFCRVAHDQLPLGVHHTTANIIQPDTISSGDIYELYGSCEKPLTHIPFEFYTLEPHREWVFFEDRDQLIDDLKHPHHLQRVFTTSRTIPGCNSAVFINKGTQLHTLKEEDWSYDQSSACRHNPSIDAVLHNQAEFPILNALEENTINSQGVLLTHYFPSTTLKPMLLSPAARTAMKRIYFQEPSRRHGPYFSQQDRWLLQDLYRFGIDCYWLDQSTLLQYTQRPQQPAGMFVPPHRVAEFHQALLFGVYGSNLFEDTTAQLIQDVLAGVQASVEKPLAIVTGGGPGAMAMGNRVAQNLSLLSCGRVVKFGAQVHEQQTNPHLDAKMTYRLDCLVERQAEFSLDFPIFVAGGIGTDFEFCLEEVRRKTGSGPITPVLLLGHPDYWRAKIRSRTHINRQTGSIAGSEWVANCFFNAQTPQACHALYNDYFAGRLAIGPGHPVPEDGFVLL